MVDWRICTTVAFSVRLRCQLRGACVQQEGFTIVATIGDQASDLSGENTGYIVKLPNYMFTIE